MLSHPQEEIKLLGSTVQGPLYVTHLTALQKKQPSFLGKVAPQEDGEPSQGKGQVRQASVSLSDPSWKGKKKGGESSACCASEFIDSTGNSQEQIKKNLPIYLL